MAYYYWSHPRYLQDPHYFMGKGEILGWINDTLGLRLSKVEETCNGAVACQLLDALHPGMVNMKKVSVWGQLSYASK